MLDSPSSFPTSQFIYMIPTFSLFDLSSGSIYLFRHLPPMEKKCIELCPSELVRIRVWCLQLLISPDIHSSFPFHSSLSLALFSLLACGTFPTFSQLLPVFRFHVDGGRLHTVSLSLGKVQNQRDCLCSTPLPRALLLQSPP